jgi:hypothetical protein
MERNAAMTPTDTHEIFQLEGKPMRESGMGHSFSAIQELQIGTDTLVFRHDSNSSYTGQQGRWGERTSFSFWYTIFGWKASERYHSDDMKLSAMRVRPIRSTDRTFVEQKLRELKTIGASVRVIVKDWSQS